MATPLPGIEHVILLMLENRSFDNVLGGLGASYSPPLSQDQFNGLTGQETNPLLGFAGPVQVYQAQPGSVARKIPAVDPGEFFKDMSEQIYGYDRAGLANPTSGTPNMEGFAINYDHVARPGSSGIQQVMQYFDPENVPITSALARLFAVSDTWYGSAPCQTYPNRVFSICGLPAVPQSNGTVFIDDVDYFTQVPSPPGSPNVTWSYGSVDALSIFELLDLQYPTDVDFPNWKVYFHDTALSSIVTYVNEAWNAGEPSSGTSVNVAYYDGSDYGPLPAGYRTFANDVANDALPKFSIIEPRYYSNWTPANLPPNSNHPGSSISPTIIGSLTTANGNVPNQGTDTTVDVADGEALLADVFANLFNYPKVARKTLLIVTYDEHGGVYDHVPPPTDAPCPFADSGVGPFNYTRFGPRVPAIFINPSIAPGTVFRPQDPNSSYQVFDHTSILRTLLEQFGLTTGPGSPPATITQLTDRDGQMPSLTGLITLDAPRPVEDLADPRALREMAAALQR